MTDVPAATGDPTGQPGLTAQVARSGAWSLAGQITVLAASFVATPFTVRLLGPSAYGLLALVNSLVAYVSVFDLGMGVASTKFASEAYGRGDVDGEVAAVCTAVLITAVPVLAVACVVVVVAPWGVGHLLHVSEDLRGAATVALRLGAVALAARVIANVVNTPELVRLRWDLYVVISNGTSLVQIAFVPIVIAWGHGVVAATVVIALTAVAVVFLHVAAGIRLLPALRHPTVRRELVAPLLGYGGALLVGNVAGVALGNAERFLLAAQEPIRSVGFYSVAANLAALLSVLPIAVTQPLLPAFSRLFAAGDHEQVALLYRRALTAILAVVLPGALVLGVLGGWVLRVWAGADFSVAATGALRVLVVGLVINAVTLVAYNLLLAAGESRTVAVCHLMELPLYPLYAFVIITRWGVLGAAMVWTIRVAIGTAFVFVAAARRVPAARGVWPALGRFAGPLAVLALPVVAELVGASVGVAAAVCVPALAAYAYLLQRHVLDDGERALLLRQWGRFRVGGAGR